MAVYDFLTWLDKHESSAFTRLRRDAALGLKPPIPAASVHSRSTAHPFEKDKLADDCDCKDCKKGKKCPCKKKIKKKKVNESEAHYFNTELEDFLNKLDALKQDEDELKEKSKEKKEKAEAERKLDKRDGKKCKSKKNDEDTDEEDESELESLPFFSDYNGSSSESFPPSTSTGPSDFKNVSMSTNKTPSEDG